MLHKHLLSESIHSTQVEFIYLWSDAPQWRLNTGPDQSASGTGALAFPHPLGLKLHSLWPRGSEVCLALICSKIKGLIRLCPKYINSTSKPGKQEWMEK